jgi:hypothetical protein
MSGGDVRGSLQTAFARAPDLQPSPDFTERLRDHLRSTAGIEDRRRSHYRGWLALVAGLALVVGLTASVIQHGSSVPLDALTSDAVGDHWNCALKNRTIRMPVPLEEAAPRFDRAYRLLLSVPPDNIFSRGGVAHVLERHSCSFGTRRFGHVILEYHSRIVSLLLTAQDEESPKDVVPPNAVPSVRGRSANGYAAVSVGGAGHTVLLVSDLDAEDLVQLSDAVSVPLLQQLERNALLSNQQPLAAACLRAAVENLIAPGS